MEMLNDFRERRNIWEINEYLKLSGFLNLFPELRSPIHYPLHAIQGHIPNKESLQCFSHK